MQMDQIKLAVIGCGLMGSLYARIIHAMPDAQVVAVADLDETRSAALASEVGAVAFSGSDFDALFARQPDIDAVFVVTPEDAHVAPVLAALRAGKHVMVEKPLATSVEDARALAEAATEAGVITMLGYSLRFDPRYAALKASVDRGDVGEIIHLSARRNMAEGVLKRLNGRVELPYWIGVHDIDLMCWITGSPVRSVMAMATNRGMHDFNVQTAFHALLRFDNGAVAALENAWAVGPLVGRPQGYSFRVEGTKGQAQVRSYEQGVTIFTDQVMIEPDTYYSPTVYGRVTGVYPSQLGYFIDCVRAGQATDMPFSTGLDGVLVADAILRSARERQEIVL